MSSQLADTAIQNLRDAKEKIEKLGRENERLQNLNTLMTQQLYEEKARGKNDDAEKRAAALWEDNMREKRHTTALIKERDVLVQCNKHQQGSLGKLTRGLDRLLKSLAVWDVGAKTYAEEVLRENGVWLTPNKQTPAAEESPRGEREPLLVYLRSKVDAGDWHAVSDAANDLRVLEGK